MLWNWKSAILSIILRVPVFAVAAARHGPEAIALAAFTEAVVCGLNAGCYAAVVQVLRNREPIWLTAFIIGVALPTIGEIIEYQVHLWRGTPHTFIAVVISSVLSAVSSLFSWYAERRSLPLLGFVPRRWRQRLARNIRECCFLATGRFYKIPRVLMAPNRELIELLEQATQRPCYLMSRGVDTELFHPRRRTRQPGPFTIGYVGRITVEKNVESLIEIERALMAAGICDYRFLVVGQGASEDLLRSNLQQADFTGVLQGEELAQAYANMDVFLFPSKTDTFGNVVLEAMASGVPALVTNQGGPQFIISAGVSGFVCGSTSEFVDCLARLQQSPEMLETMRHRARKQAEGASWDSVFAAVQRAYQVAVQSSPRSGGPLNVKFGASAVAKT